MHLLIEPVSLFHLPYGLLCWLQIAHHIPQFSYLIGFVCDKWATLSRLCPCGLDFFFSRRSTVHILGMLSGSGDRRMELGLQESHRGPAACVYHGFRNMQSTIHRTSRC